MIENQILKKKNFPAEICLGEALFPPLVKAKNQLQNLENYLKQKRCAITCLNVPNLCYFSKKKFNWKKIPPSFSTSISKTFLLLSFLKRTFLKFHFLILKWVFLILIWNLVLDFLILCKVVLLNFFSRLMNLLFPRYFQVFRVFRDFRIFRDFRGTWNGFHAFEMVLEVKRS